MLFELLVVNPKLLELLVKTFDASRYAGDLLIRRPQLLEEITRARDARSRSVASSEHLRRLDALKITPASLDLLRVYRQTQLLRIFLRDVLGLADLPALFTEQSALAEACLIFVNRVLRERERRHDYRSGKIWRRRNRLRSGFGCAFRR